MDQAPIYEDAPFHLATNVPGPQDTGPDKIHPAGCLSREKVAGK